MSTSFDHVTHHFAKNPENGTFHVAKVTPIVRVNSGGQSLFLQQGRVLDAGGGVVKDLPGWFYEEVAKVSDQALHDAGFKTRPVADVKKG